MQAWRVHGYGEPGEQFVLDEVPEPKPADFAGLGMDLGGWVPLQPGAEPFTDWVLMKMSSAALALPDVTMAKPIFRDGRLVAFSATTDADTHSLYWFVDDAYIGKSVPGETLSWQPAVAGNFRIRAVDDHGRSDDRTLTVTLVE